MAYRRVRVTGLILAVLLIAGSASAQVLILEKDAKIDELLSVEIVRRDQFVESFDGTKIDTALFVAKGATPPSDGWPAIIFAHGGGSNKEQWVARAKMYASQGYVTMTFRARGHGASDGVRMMKRGVEGKDLKCLVDWMTEHADVNPLRVGITGSSYGGYNSWHLAMEYPLLRAAAPMNYAAVGGLLNEVSEHRVTFVRLSLIGGRDESGKRAVQSVIDEYYGLNLPEERRSPRTIDRMRLRVPVYVREAWLDKTIIAQNVIDVYQEVLSTKRLYLGTGGHHSPTVPEEILYD